MIKTFEVKDDIILEDLLLLKPAAMILLTHTILYCQEHNLPCKITSLIHDRDNIKSKSRTHEEGRAFDISVKNKLWTQSQINRFVWHINASFREIAAISASDGKARAAVYHDSGFGKHIHLQVRANAPFERFLKYDNILLGME